MIYLTGSLGRLAILVVPAMRGPQGLAVTQRNPQVVS